MFLKGWRELNILKNNNEVYVFKDQDGYFLGKKGSCICKKITKKEFEYYKRHLPEYEVKGENNNGNYKERWHGNANKN